MEKENRKKKKLFEDDIFELDDDENVRKMEERLMRLMGDALRNGGQMKVYGFSMSAGPEDDEEESRAGETEEEPLVDVMEYGGEITVVAQIPCASEGGIKADATPDSLSIRCRTQEGEYLKDIALPAKVRPETMKRSYKNGVLEIRLEKEEKK